MARDYDLARRGFLAGVGATSLGTRWRWEDRDAAVVSPYVEREEDFVRLGNERFELTFRRDNGGIAQFRAKEPGFVLRSATPFPALTWGLRFYHPEYRNLMTASYMAGPPTIETAEGRDMATVTLRWADPPLKAPPHGRLDERFSGTIEVEASAAANDPDSRWHLRVANDGDQAIRKTICPQITNIAPLAADGTDALYLPSRLGRKYPNPTELGYGPVHRYPSGFGTMQFVAYLADGAGVYAAAEDTDGYAKRLQFESREGRRVLGYRGVHLVPYRPGADVTVPYPMTFGVHTGTWRDACDRYRAWVESEGWLADATPTVPDRLRERGVSVHERSYTRSGATTGGDPIEFETMEAMVSNLRERLDVPMGFRWWGWETHGRPAGGDWFPPYEGREAFESVVGSLADNGVDTIGFLNPTVLLESSDYWDSLANPSNLPITARDGEPRTYSGVGLTFDKVAPTTEQWQDHYRTALTALVESGIAHLDIDGFPWQWVPNCWNDAHDHPDGKGGNWFPQRMRRLLRELHEEYDVSGGLCLGGEGIADFYLPFLNVHVVRDGMVEFDDPAVRRGDAEVVPMFPYTFGDYAATRTQKGHIGEHADQQNIQRLIAGRALAWGSIPLFMGHYDPAPGEYDEALLDYYARIGAARTGYANRFLAHGEMLARPDLDRRTVTIDQRGVTTETSELRGRGWRSPAGDLGIVLTNVSNRETTRTVRIDLESQPFELRDDSLVYTVMNGRYRAAKETTVMLNMAPSDVALIGTVPDTDPAREAITRIEEAQATDGVDGETLTAAKRAFDDHEFEQAIRKASIALDTVDTTTTKATTDTPSTARTSTTRPAPATQPSASKPSRETTTGIPSQDTRLSTMSTGDTPGFGIPPVVAGLIGSAAVWRWRSDDADESND